MLISEGCDVSGRGWRPRTPRRPRQTGPPGEITNFSHVTIKGYFVSHTLTFLGRSPIRLCKRRKLLFTKFTTTFNSQLSCNINVLLIGLKPTGVLTSPSFVEAGSFCNLNSTDVEVPASVCGIINGVLSGPQRTDRTKGRWRHEGH